MTNDPSPRLGEYDTGDFKRGKPVLVELAWLVVQSLFVSSFIPGSAHRRFLLKLFGAKIGSGVVIKPGVRVKFPWRLIVGRDTWIGEAAWIDNLAVVTIGSNACLSQGCYLCTGNHDWSSKTFDLRVAPITLADGSWVAAKAVIGPGVTIGENAIVALGAVAANDVPPQKILVAGSALSERSRRFKSDPSR